MAEFIRDQGDVPRLRVNYALLSATDGTAFAVDPTSVTLEVRRPDLVTITPTVLSDATGSYYADLTLHMPGVWRFKWESTGQAAGVEEGIYFARPNNVE